MRGDIFHRGTLLSPVLFIIYVRYLPSFWMRMLQYTILKFMTLSLLVMLRGWLSKKINVFKELASRFRTYALRGQGTKYRKEIISTNPRQTSTSHCPTKTIAKNDHQSLKERVVALMSEIRKWVRNCKLKLNDNKTKAIILSK